MVKKIIAKNRKELQSLILDEIELKGNNCDLNHIDVSQVEDMSSLFSYSQFNGDISQWDISRVTNMNMLFAYSEFNGDISKWNTSNVKNMSQTFFHSLLNTDISNWDVSKVTGMEYMFACSKFKQDLTKWEPISIIYNYSMFFDCKAPVPYWFDVEDIKAAISSYRFNQLLDSFLMNNNYDINKVKI